VADQPLDNRSEGRQFLPIHEGHSFVLLPPMLHVLLLRSYIRTAILTCGNHISRDNPDWTFAFRPGTSSTLMRILGMLRYQFRD